MTRRTSPRTPAARANVLLTMRRLPLLVVLLATAAILPGAARAAGCSPLDCAPSQIRLAGGRLLAVRAAGADGNVRVVDLRTGRTRWWLPPGTIGGRLLVHEDGTLLTWFDATTGARIASTVAALHGFFSLAGSSQDGRQAVLTRIEKRRTTFVIVSPAGQRQIALAGNSWSLDALAGNRLYLIHSLRNGYQVRVYDLARNRLDPHPLKDPDGSALIRGAPWQRLSTPDGRYLFTLYLGSDGSAMIHELDLTNATANCIDLPGTGDFNAAGTYALALSPDARTLWAASPGYRRVVAIGVRSHRVRLRFPLTNGAWTANAGTAALSPDGARLALTDGQHLWIVDLTRKRILSARPHAIVALGFSPDNKRLWMIGERSSPASIPAPSPGARPAKSPAGHA